MNTRMIAAAVVAIALAPTAFATTIAGLTNTGVGLPNGSVDQNYALTVTSGTTTGLGAFGYASDSVHPNWMSSDALSKWLTPGKIATTSFDPSSNGVYDWKLSFDLTGYDAATASFSGQFAADNAATVWLNGVQLTTASTGGFKGWTSFAASSGFQSGINTLDFKVTNYAQNGGNPTGLRVEFTASSVAAVPEPETYAMLLAGLGLMGTVARRRKNKQA